VSGGAAAAPLAPWLCPRCGGAVGVREGSRLGRCSHCRAPLLARCADGDLRYALRPSLDAAGAGERVRALLRGPDVPGDLARRAVLQGIELFFVPYWRFQSTIVGRLRGTRQVRRRGLEALEGEEPGRTRFFRSDRELTRTEQVDAPIREIWRATLSACPVDDLGVPTLSPLRQRSAGMLVTRHLGAIPGMTFFDASLFHLGKVLDVMVPREAALAQAEALLRRFLDTRGFDVEGKDLRVLRLQDRTYLLYYPVFVVRFRYRGRVYRATIDGHHGGVIHAHLPGDSRHALGAVLGVTLGAALVTAAPLRLVLFPPEGLEDLAGLARDPRLWIATAAVAAGLAAAARYALGHVRLDSERVVHG
jgi:hypothetical protein